MTQYLAPTPRELGALVRGFRKDRGWTQAQLAEQVGLYPKTISLLETGGGNVLLATAMRCLAALEVDVCLATRNTATQRAGSSLVGRSSTKDDSRSGAVPTQEKPAATRARNEKW